MSLKNTSYLKKSFDSSMKTSIKLKLIESARKGSKALRSTVFELLGGANMINGITKEQFETDNRWVESVINSLREFDRTEYSTSELERIVLFLFQELEIKESTYKALHESVEFAYYHKGGLL